MSRAILNFKIIIPMSVIAFIVWGAQRLIADAIERMVPHVATACSASGFVMNGTDTGALVKLKCGERDVYMGAENTVSYLQDPTKTPHCTELVGEKFGDVEWNCELK